jgi:chromosome segregation ATPase
MSHAREPIKHTCPDIDKVIKRISAACKDARHTIHDTEEDLRSKLDWIDSELNGLDSDLEDLRRSNSALRDWGTEEAERVDKLESDLAEWEA